MSEKLLSLTWRKVIKALNRTGFRALLRRGSYVYLTDGKHRITVLRHETIKKGTLISTQQAGSIRDEFPKLLKK